MNFVLPLTCPDGCPEEVSSDCSDIDMIKWPEKEIGEVATVRCPCGPEGENPLPSQPVTTRQCEGNYDNGARWGPQMCTECQFSGIRTSLCQLLNVRMYVCIYILTCINTCWKSVT